MPGNAEDRSRLRHRYRVLRRLLAANSEMLELMGDLEADLAHLDPGERAVRQPVLRMLDGSLLLSENLNILTGGEHTALYEAHARIERDVRSALGSFPDPATLPFWRPLEEANREGLRDVGGKAANLGPLRAAMPGVVPSGFVLTTAAYRFFLSVNKLHGPIRRLYKDLSLITGRQLFRERTAEIRALVTQSRVPQRVLEAIRAGLERFGSPPPARWAVRSSAVGEDGRMSFAGQFDSVLQVPVEDLASAYKSVLASRYNDHAVLYRLAGGFSEVETPMAALFMPMLEARAAGVLYTRDPADASADCMLVDAVSGLADAMVRGDAAASSALASRSRPGELCGGGEKPGFPIDADALRRLVELGLAIEGAWEKPVDMEWVLTPQGTLAVVQARPLRAVTRAQAPSGEVEGRKPLVEGGMTVFPGRAVGPVFLATTLERLLDAPDGAILVAPQAAPELAAVLPRVAGLVAEQGNPAGHAAALVREFAVPTLFGVPDAVRRLGARESLSLDATQRAVFDGAIWPEVQERVRSRIRHLPARRLQNPLHEHVLALNLTNPLASDFRASACRSVHDVVRFTHEKAVAAMFDFGDAVARPGQRRVFRLESEVPLDLAVLDLGAALPPLADRRSVRPAEIESPPFQALWRGIARPGVSWAGRTQIGVAGFLSVVASSMSDPRASLREVGGQNYLMVAPDYVNLNARLAYHFAMVDAFVSPAPENNFVNFRFRGGGAGHDRRDLRARFLAEVLSRAAFAVDRRGDLVTAWLRRYPRPRSEEALELLGALMGCARQLDMIIEDEAAAHHLAERFLAGDYAAFA